MKALSIYGMYADCIAASVKTVEWRSWPTKYRGELLICASALNPPEWDNLYITGQAICTVQLTGCDLFSGRHHRGYHFDWPPKDGYAWILEDVRIIKPVPVKGKQRIFEVDVTPEYLDIDYKDAQRYWHEHKLISAVGDLSDL